MKNIMLLTVLFFFWAMHGHAQVKWGIKAGINFYNFTGSGANSAGLEDSHQLKPGVVAGIISEIRLSKSFTLQPGLLYSQEGNLQKADGNKVTYKLNYMNLPIMLQYRDYSGFFGETGPHLGFLTDAKLNMQAGGSGTEESISDQAEKMVFAWAVGCGWVFKSGIGINARSQWGVSSVFKNGNVNSSGFNATVFYLF